MLEDIKRLTNTAGELDELTDSGSLTSFLKQRIDELNGLKSKIGTLAVEDRRDAGRALNEARQAVEEAVGDRLAVVAASERATQLETERMDLTEVVAPTDVGHAHIVTQTWEELEDVFVGMGFRIAEGPHVETDWHNFDALNIPKGHPARDGFDTIYVNHGEPGSSLLRTHTSPVQIRTMLGQKPPIAIVAPGRVFRRDTADATHMPVFHQIEGLVIDRDITLADLTGTIDAFMSAYFGKKLPSRLRPNYFPFTEPSAEYDLQQADGSWLEMAGCGMVHPNVLRAVDLDPEEWSGFAFGFGIDRLALMKYGVNDLRDMYSNDVRFLEQF